MRSLQQARHEAGQGWPGWCPGAEISWSRGFPPSLEVRSHPNQPAKDRGRPHPVRYYMQAEGLPCFTPGQRTRDEHVTDTPTPACDPTVAAKVVLSTSAETRGCRKRVRRESRIPIKRIACPICLLDLYGFPRPLERAASDDSRWAYTNCCKTPIHWHCRLSWGTMQNTDPKTRDTKRKVSMNITCPFCRQPLRTNSSQRALVHTLQ